MLKERRSRYKVKDTGMPLCRCVMRYKHGAIYTWQVQGGMPTSRHFVALWPRFFLTVPTPSQPLSPPSPAVSVPAQSLQQASPRWQS